MAIWTMLMLLGRNWGVPFVLAVSTVATAGLTIFSVLELDRRLAMRRIDRAFDILEDVLARCRSEDMRAPQVYTTLRFLEQYASQKWPFEQFREALEKTGFEGWQAEGRWQNVSASLNGIKLAVHWKSAG